MIIDYYGRISSHAHLNLSGCSNQSSVAILETVLNIF